VLFCNDILRTCPDDGAVAIATYRGDSIISVFLNDVWKYTHIRRLYFYVQAFPTNLSYWHNNSGSALQHRHKDHVNQTPQLTTETKPR